MFVAGVNNATAMRIARYQAEALQQVDKSSARIASNRRFTSFAEDPVSATREISLRSQRGSTNLYLRATQEASAAAEAAAAGLQAASDILGKMREAVLGVTADNYTVVKDSLDTWAAQITRIASTTTSVDGTALLDATGAKFNIDGSEITVHGMNLATTATALAAIAFTNGDSTERTTALGEIKTAQDAITAGLTKTSALSSALGYQVTARASQVSAIDAAIDNLVSVDVAEETLKMTQNSLRAEASAAMLAQVNALHYSMVRQLLMAR